MKSSQCCSSKLMSGGWHNALSPKGKTTDLVAHRLVHSRPRVQAIDRPTQTVTIHQRKQESPSSLAPRTPPSVQPQPPSCCIWRHIRRRACSRCTTTHLDLRAISGAPRAECSWPSVQPQSLPLRATPLCSSVGPARNHREYRASTSEAGHFRLRLLLPPASQTSPTDRANAR